LAVGQQAVPSSLLLVKLNAISTHVLMAGRPAEAENETVGHYFWVVRERERERGRESDVKTDHCSSIGAI
jgi:hypothetical protein